MAQFPALKGGAPLQHPAARTIRFRTHVSRFLDGSEQRFRQHAGPSVEWSSSMALLDGAEAAAIEQFFGAGMGRFGAHSFVDPWDGVAHTHSRMATDGLTTTQTGEESFRVDVHLEEGGN